MQTGGDRTRADSDGLQLVEAVFLLVAFGGGTLRFQHRQHDGLAGRARAGVRPVSLAFAVLFLAVQHGDLRVWQRRWYLPPGCARAGIGRIGLALVVLLPNLERSLALVVLRLKAERRDLRFGLR